MSAADDCALQGVVILRQGAWKFDAAKFFIRSYTEGAEQVNRKICGWERGHKGSRAEAQRCRSSYGGALLYCYAALPVEA